eukprot:gene2139-7535_t
MDEKKPAGEQEILQYHLATVQDHAHGPTGSRFDFDPKCFEYVTNAGRHNQNIRTTNAWYKWRA